LATYESRAASMNATEAGVRTTRELNLSSITISPNKTLWWARGGTVVCQIKHLEALERIVALLRYESRVLREGKGYYYQRPAICGRDRAPTDYELKQPQAPDNKERLAS